MSDTSACLWFLDWFSVPFWAGVFLIFVGFLGLIYRAGYAEGRGGR